MKLVDTLLIAAAVGFLLMWGLEIQRGAGFIDSYWLLLAALGCLLGFQYRRVKRRQATKALSPTIKQMATDRAKKPVQPAQKAKKR